MKKGVILYVAEGREGLSDWPDLAAQQQNLKADALCIATSETEVAYGWWQMLARGMHQVSCVRAAYDASRDIVELRGGPLRLYG